MKFCPQCNHKLIAAPEVCPKCSFVLTTSGVKTLGDEDITRELRSDLSDLSDATLVEGYVTNSDSTIKQDYQEDDPSPAASPTIKIPPEHLAALNTDDVDAATDSSDITLSNDNDLSL